MRETRGLGKGRAAAGVVVSAAMLLAAGTVAGCKRTDPQVNAIDAMNGVDPSDANMAPVQASDAEAAAEGVGAPGYADAGQPGYATPAGTVQQGAAVRQTTPTYRRAAAGTLNESQAAARAYASGQAPAPVERRDPEQYNVPGATQAGYQQDPYAQGGYQDGYPTAEQAGDDAQALSDELDANVDPNEVAAEPPPPLPDYEQPPAPGDDYLWTPGYWGYAPAGYYWVPGAWVSAPFVGALWTPGYWGPWHGRYCFHHGYWGRYVGFYGGIAYGFGYYGTGYHGGFWNGNHFAYNRAVTNVNVVNVHNVYNRTVIVNNIRINNSVTNRYVNNVNFNNRVSYNGGRGGVQARPEPAELAALRQRRIAPLPAQRENQQQAERNRGQFFAQRQERPATVVSRPIQTERIAAPAVVPTSAMRQPASAMRQPLSSATERQANRGSEMRNLEVRGAGLAQQGAAQTDRNGGGGRFDGQRGVAEQHGFGQQQRPGVLAGDRGIATEANRGNAGQPAGDRNFGDRGNVNQGYANQGYVNQGYGNQGYGRRGGFGDRGDENGRRPLTAGAVQQPAPTPSQQTAPGQQVSSPGRQEVFGNGAPGRQQVFQQGGQPGGGLDQQQRVINQQRSGDQQRALDQQQRVQDQQQRMQQWQQQRQAEQGGQPGGGGWQDRQQQRGYPTQQQAPQEQPQRSFPMQSQPQQQQRSFPAQQQRSVPMGAPQGQQRSVPMGGGGQQGGGHAAPAPGGGGHQDGGHGRR